MPGPVEFRQEILRRCAAAQQPLVEHPQIPRLVLARGVELFAAREPGMGEPKDLGGDFKYGATMHLRGERKFWDVVAQLLPLFRGPVLGQVPGGIERIVVIKNADPERRKCQQIRQRTGIGTAHFQIAFEPDLGKGRA